MEIVNKPIYQKFDFIKLACRVHEITQGRFYSPCLLSAHLTLHQWQNR